MADCAACGLLLPAGARYCRHCGVGVAEAGRLRGYARPDPADRTGLPAQPRPDPPGADPSVPTRPGVTRPAVSAPAVSAPAVSAPAVSGAARPSAPGSGSGSAVTRRAEPAPTRRTGRALPAIVALLSLVVVVVFAVATARRLAGPERLSGSPAPVGGALGGGTPAAPGPSPPPGRVAVQLTPSLQDAPHAAAVVALFRQYFQAINDRDYDSWVATLSSDRIPDPEPTFQEQYSTTVDDDIRVVGINPQEDGSLQAAVSFRSRQDPRYAPPDQPVDCLRWQIAYPLTFEGGRLKIAKVERVNRTYRPCSDNLTHPG